MTSKFPVQCPACSNRHPAGTEITKRDGKWVPASCGASPATSRSTAPVTGSSRSSSRSSYPRRSRTVRYCDGWGADNPHAPRPDNTCTECES